MANDHSHVGERRKHGEYGELFGSILGFHGSSPFEGAKKTPGTTMLRVQKTDETACFVFFHPDYTVGFGIAPNPAPKALADYTAGREFHPAPKTLLTCVYDSTDRLEMQEGKRLWPLNSKCWQFQLRHFHHSLNQAAKYDNISGVINWNFVNGRQRALASPFGRGAPVRKLGRRGS